MELDIQELSMRIVNNAIREGFDEAIALVDRKNIAMTKIFNSEISVVQKWHTISVYLYLAKNRRIFITVFELQNLDEINRSIKEILSSVEKIYESTVYAPIPSPKHVEPLNIVDKSLIEFMDNINTLAELVIETGHRENINNIAGTIEIVYREKALSTSTLVSTYEAKTWITTYARAFMDNGSGQWSYTSTKLNTRELEETILIASRYAHENRNKIGIEPGIYDMILSPIVFANLINCVAEMTSAFSLLTGTSMFMNKSMGSDVASSKLSIYDAPRDEDLPNSTGFDDEAIKTFNKPIIDNGVLTTILHNTKTAHIMNADSTGNAGWITPRPWNIMIRGGDISLDEMISEVRRGLFVTNNWYTRLHNYIEGEFSTITRDAAFLIENGKILGSIGRIRIVDKFTNILNNIDMIGKELYKIYWWEVEIPTKSPYILARDIRISST